MDAPPSSGRPRRSRLDAAVRSARRQGARVLGHEYVVVVGILAALTLAFFGPVLRGSTMSVVPTHQGAVYPWQAQSAAQAHAYPQTDQADLNHPWQAWISRTLRSGAFPFWDPHSFGGGYPFFGNGQSAVLYPPRLVTALALSPSWAHDVFSMLHVFLSGLCMYALLRELRVGPVGALFAAVAWMFGGFNMAWLQLEVVTPLSVFLPLALLCVHRAFRVRSWTATLVAGAVLGLTLLSGHIILVGIVYMVAAGYAAALAGRQALSALGRGGREEALLPVARWAVMLSASLGVAAVVLVPTAFSLAGSQRDPFTYHELRTGVSHLVDGDLPLLAPVGNLRYAVVPPPLPITAPRMHEMAFVGTATALFAVVGLFLRRPGAWLARVLLLLSVAVAVGTPATWLAYHLVPGFRIFRPYSRLFVLSGFAIALAGGLAVDALLGWGSRARPAPRRFPLRAGATGPAVVALAVVALVANTVQLARYGREVNPRFVARTPASLFPATPLIRAIEAETHRPGRWPGRIVPVQLPGAAPFFGADALLFGIDSTGGYDSVVPRRVTALVRVLQGEHPDHAVRTGLSGAYAPGFPASATRFDLLARLGVTTIVTPPGPDGQAGPVPGLPLATRQVYAGRDGILLRVLEAPAGPYVVHGDQVTAGGAAALRRFVDPAFDFRRSVVLERAELRRTGTARLGAGTGEGGVVMATRGVNSARITVTGSAPGWLVLPESWAPGWSARVNGAPAPVLRANYAGRAVPVPAGEAHVVLHYSPVGFAGGLVATLATVLVGAAVCASERGRRRRARALTPR